MSPVEILPPGADRETWLAARAGGIGASEIAAVLRISPYESPFSLFWRKAQGWQTEENAAMQAGHRAEPVIATWFAEQVKDPSDPEYHVRPAGLYANAERPWQRATPDRLVYSLPPEGHGRFRMTALLECKYLVGGWDGWGEPDTDDIPPHYRAQCLWQLDVMGVDDVYVAAWHGAEFRQYRVRRDEKDLRVMRAAGLDFWRRITAGDPPDIDGHQATIGALKKLHPTIEDVDVQVPVEFAEGYRRVRDLARRTAALVDRYDARARQMLGAGRRLMVGRQLVVSRSVYDQSGDSAELMAIDDAWPTTDRLNPGRAKSYVN